MLVFKFPPHAQNLQSMLWEQSLPCSFLDFVHIAWRPMTYRRFVFVAIMGGSMSWNGGVKEWKRGEGFRFCDLFADERSHVGGKNLHRLNVYLNINNNGNKHIATLAKVLWKSPYYCIMNKQIWSRRAKVGTFSPSVLYVYDENEVIIASHHRDIVLPVHWIY